MTRTFLVPLYEIRSSRTSSEAERCVNGRATIIADRRAAFVACMFNLNSNCNDKKSMCIEGMQTHPSVWPRCDVGQIGCNAVAAVCKARFGDCRRIYLGVLANAHKPGSMNV